MRRILRAVTGIATMWALAWLPVGGALAIYASGRPPQPSDLIHRPVAVVPFLAAWTAWGGLSGAAFSLVLALRERRRTLRDLTVRRTALWGALGALLLPALLIVAELVRTPAGLRADWPLPLLVLSLSATLGGGCAALTLLLARRQAS